MKVLITGGAGFIGSHLADRLLAEGHEVLVIDNYATGRRDNLTEHDALTIVEDTIEDAGAVLEAFEGFNPDFVVHAAAAYKDPDAWGQDVLTNALGTVNVVRAAQATGVKRHPLLPDGALLRHDADRAAGHARAIRSGPTRATASPRRPASSTSSCRAWTSCRSGWPTPTARATSPGRCRPSTTA